MLALRKIRPEFGAALEEIAAPPVPPAPGMVRLRVAAAGICGSDLHAYEWSAGYEFMAPLLPLTIGHEFSGRVAAVGAGVEGFAPGDPVTCWPTVACGHCAGCAAGRPDECRARRIIGLHRDGGFAEVIDIPAATCFALPPGLPLDLAALTEPLAVAVNAVDLAEAGPGDAVAVLGPGPIGLAAAWVAQGRGAEVLVAGHDDALRLDCARRLGLKHTADLAQETLAEAARRVFGREADRVIEATGHAPVVAEALGILRPRGILVVAGIHSRPAQIDLTRLVREKKQIRGAHDTTPPAFREAIALLAARGAELAPMITNRRPLSEAVAAFEAARRRTAVKVLLIPGLEGTR